MQLPYRVEKPWGWEEIWAKTDKYVGKLLHIRVGQQLSLQYHKVKEETIFIKRGTLTLLHEGKVYELHPGDCFHIKPGEVHRMCAEMTLVEVIEVSTPELDDVVRLKDSYGRVMPPSGAV
jgi:mannose-6-phosphate isomerase